MPFLFKIDKRDEEIFVMEKLLSPQRILVVEGKSSAEIAEILKLSPKTVETYRSRLMGKLGINNLQGLIKFAVENGLIPI